MANNTFSTVGRQVAECRFPVSDYPLVKSAALVWACQGLISGLDSGRTPHCEEETSVGRLDPVDRIKKKGGE